ncbi:MAG TPA: hypothetical protein VNJ04_04515 [Gemmatimonadaceae bacterium]|nr:hypothetical protein [Gemmatimonadaceae bacterium]
MTVTDNGRRLPLTGAFLALVLAACGGDGAVAPEAEHESASIRVTVQTTGGDPDNNGYQLLVGETKRAIANNQVVIIGKLSPGSHTVALAELAQNCIVEGTHPLAVTVTAGRSAEVGFRVTCEASGFEVTTRTTGSDIQPGYQLFLNGGLQRALAPNGTILFTRIPPGTYSLELRFSGDNCSVVGAPPKIVEVSNRKVTPVLFEIACVPPVRLEKIAYNTTFGLPQFLNGFPQIFLVNVDGSAPVELALGSDPAWSPDGTRLLFNGINCEYYGCEIDGLEIIDPETRNTRPLRGTSGAKTPTWSPGGDAIAFSYGNNFDPSNRTVGVHVMLLDGSPRVRLAHPGVVFASTPDWSPDGKRIAFTCVVVDGNSDICLSNADGTGVVRLTSHIGRETDPEWSPDGRRIAFTRHSDRQKVAVMNADGSAVTEIAEGSDPAWSRDGSRIVFVAPDGLFIINVDGSNPKRLTTGFNHRAPAWRP